MFAKGLSFAGLPSGYTVERDVHRARLVVVFGDKEIGTIPGSQMLTLSPVALGGLLAELVATHQKLSALEGKIAKAVAAAALHARKTRLPPYWALRTKCL